MKLMSVLSLPFTLSILFVTLWRTDTQFERRPVYSMEPPGLRKTETKSACNRTIHEDGAVLLSHDFTHKNYLKNITCITYIQAPKGRVVALVFEEKFDIEGYSIDPQTYKCVDSLKIYDGENVSDARYMLTPATGICGIILPMSLRSTHGNLSLKWQTNGSGNYLGFSVFVVFFHEKKCYAAKGEFMCQNGRCLKLQHRCDAINSCGGSDVSDEDERTCLTLMGRPPGWDYDGSRRFADFLLSPFGIVLGWSLFFLLLVALTFAGCASLCYILMCGSITRSREETVNVYTLKQLISAHKSGDSRSLQSSTSNTGQVALEILKENIPGQPEPVVIGGKGLVKAKPNRRATEPLPAGHRQSNKASIAEPRRFTTPNIPTHPLAKSANQLPTHLDEPKLVDKEALTKTPINHTDFKALLAVGKKPEATGLPSGSPAKGLNDTPASKTPSTPPSSPASERLEDLTKYLEDETTAKDQGTSDPNPKAQPAPKSPSLISGQKFPGAKSDDESPKPTPKNSISHDKPEAKKTLKDFVDASHKKDKSHSGSPKPRMARLFSQPIMGGPKHKDTK